MLPFPSEHDHGNSKHRNQGRDENSISAFYGMFAILLENYLILTEKAHVHTESITVLGLLFQQVIIVGSWNMNLLGLNFSQLAPGLAIVLSREVEKEN